MAPELYVGLMSGTSLDGIDAVLARFDTASPLLATQFAAFPGALRQQLRALSQPGYDEINRSSEAALALARRYAGAVRALLDQAGIEPSAVSAIGCHGQTVRHDPARGFTVQLVNGSLLAELSGIRVVCDFRSRDIAAGGEGAPLVPAFHAAIFRHAQHARAVVNLGGIANVTYLPAQGDILGFDCGPGNALLDEWVFQVRGLHFDAGGTWAAQGRVRSALLNALLADPYFRRAPPKSTGRDVFNLDWARPHIRPEYDAADVQATLAELTAECVAAALRGDCPDLDEVYLCGGGVANTDLFARIQRLLPAMRVMSTAALGIPPDWVEALAFAWLARETLAGRPGNVPSVTGAATPRVLGCVYPK
ncbi:MAG: anhydro-N-acetylmuramic acid kinase [Burkholderiales bacterium]|nr:anhydro-N-acetylmuramic acid kinase [Burkholderiales bacterium]